MKKTVAMLLTMAMLMVTVPSLAAATPEGAAYSGKVTYRESMTLTAPFGGNLSDYSLRVGDTVSKGDALFTLSTTKVYAPIDGTVRGLMAKAGDEAASVQNRYGWLATIEPAGRYTVSGSTGNAYKNNDNNNVNRYLNPGETVYLRSSDEDERTGVGVITSVTGRSFTVEVTESNLNIEETATVYRDAKFSTSQRLASYAKVQKADVTPITAEGSILRVAVTEGQAVKRGDLLFETVEGTLLGLTQADATVTAPVDGVLLSLPKTSGVAVKQDDVLATLYAADSLWVEFEVDEGDLDAVQVGGKVQVTLDALSGRAPIAGEVQSISAYSSADDGDAKYTAYVALDTVENLRAGMTVSVYLNQ